MIGLAAGSAALALAGLWSHVRGESRTRSGSESSASSRFHSVHGEQCRLDFHRDGPSALGGASQSDRRRHDQTDCRPRCFGPCVGYRLGFADHLHPPVRSAGVVWFKLIVRTRRKVRWSTTCIRRAIRIMTSRKIRTSPNNCRSRTRRRSWTSRSMVRARRSTVHRLLRPRRIRLRCRNAHADRRQRQSDLRPIRVDGWRSTRSARCGTATRCG